MTRVFKRNRCARMNRHYSGNTIPGMVVRQCDECGGNLAWSTSDEPPERCESCGSPFTYEEETVKPSDFKQKKVDLDTDHEPGQKGAKTVRFLAGHYREEGSFSDYPERRMGGTGWKPNK